MFFYAPAARTVVFNQYSIA